MWARATSVLSLTLLQEAVIAGGSVFSLFFFVFPRFCTFFNAFLCFCFLSFSLFFLCFSVLFHAVLCFSLVFRAFFVFHVLLYFSIFSVFSVFLIQIRLKSIDFESRARSGAAGDREVNNF